MNWTFQNPWMLLWGVAAIVPLILYLLRRRNPLRVNWAAMQFLEDARRMPAARPRLRRWLLLAVRMALPLSIAVVTANPGCRNLPTDSGRWTDQATHWILAFDVSASMGPRSDGPGSLAEAIRRGREVVAEA
jgi:hypothetical protein